MRRAFYTYSYTDRLGLDIDRTLAEIARWGYEGIDESSTAGPHVNSSSVTPARRRAIRDAARRHGLRVEAIVSHAELSTSLFSPEPLDLIAALDAGQLRAATIDVFDREPLPPGHPFWTDPRILVTPHVASITSRASAARTVAANLGGWMRGEALRDVVDARRGY